MAQDTGRNGRPGQQRTGGSRPGNTGQGPHRAGWGGRTQAGQSAPVFKEINWLQRWPRLISTCFIILILLEILAFLWVAEHIGLALTLLILIGSAVIGLWLIRRTGLDMVGKLRLTLAQGQEPGHSLVDGACFVIAGLLLIVPGFFTDFAAILLMLPITRNWFIRRFAGNIVGGDFATPAGPSGGKAGRVITDVEFREVREEEATATSAASDPAQPTTAEEAAEPVAPRFEPEIIGPARPEPNRPEPGRAETGDQAETQGPATEAAPEPAKPDEEEPWGRTRRRPIIDVEES